MQPNEDLKLLIQILAARSGFGNEVQSEANAGDRLPTSEPFSLPELVASNDQDPHGIRALPGKLRILVESVLREHGGDAKAALKAVEQDFRDDPHATLRPLEESLACSKIDFETILGDSHATRPDSRPFSHATRQNTATTSTTSRFNPTSRNRPEQRFEALRKHAEGGLGQIHIARDYDLNREVALKTIKASRSDDATSRLQFLLEGEVTGSLEHPGVVPVYGMGTDASGRPYYAMRFIRGDSLAMEIERFHAGERSSNQGKRALALRKLLRRFTDVCNAMDYAHSRGVLHRDLKPDNVMVGPYGETLVVDWGLAKLIDRPPANAELSNAPNLPPETVQDLERASSRGVVGTLTFMSPEQAHGAHADLTPASDVFSLGAMLYTILTGKNVYEGCSFTDVLRRARECEFTPAREVDRSIPIPLAAICERALNKDPTARYQNARGLSDDIDAFLADQPVTAYTEPWSVRTRRWMRHHPRLVSAALSTLLVASTALTLGVGVLSKKNAQIAEQRDVATQNLQTARNAVRESLILISEDEQLKREGLAQLRERLLRAPEPFYTEFLEQAPQDRELLLEQAQWQRLLGQITEQIGSQQDALEHYQTAQRIFGKLLRERPNDSSLLQFNAQSRNDVAQILQFTGDFEGALRSAEEALADVERIPHTGIDQEMIRSSALYIISRISIAQRDFSTLTDGLTAMRASAGVISKHDDAWAAAARYDEARTRADMYIAQGKVVAAEQVLRQTIDELTQPKPPRVNNDQNASNLAVLHNTLGSHLNETGRMNAALEQFQLGHEIAVDLVARHPADVFHRETLSALENNLTVPLSESNAQPNGAAIESGLARSYEHSLEVATNNPKDYNNRLGHARILMNLGNDSLRSENLDEAQTRFDEGLDITRSLKDSMPGHIESQLVHNQLLFSESERLAASQQADQAFAKCREAMSLVQPLIDRQVDIAAYPQMANGHRLLVRLATEAGDWSTAKSEIAKWRKLYDEVPDTYREAPAYLQQLAWAAQNMVDVCLGEGDTDAAFEEVVAALSLRQELVDKFPDEPFFAAQLGWLHNWYADQLLQASGESARAQAYEQMRLGCDAVQGIDPKWISLSLLQSLYQKQVALAIFADKSEDYEKAVLRCDYAADYAETLYGRTSDTEHLIRRAQVLSSQAQFLYRLARNEESEAALRAAQEVAERVLAKEPSNSAALEERYFALLLQSDLLVQQTEYDAADLVLVKALASAGNEPTDAARLKQAVIQVRIGNYQTAVEKARSVLQGTLVEPNNYYNIACIYALASDAAATDQSLSETERELANLRFAESSIEYLTKAFSSADYANEATIASLQVDEDLASLRDREDFQALLKKLTSQD